MSSSQLFLLGKKSVSSLFNDTSAVVSNRIESVPPGANTDKLESIREKEEAAKKEADHPEEKVAVCAQGTCERLVNVDWDQLLIKYFTMVVYGRRRIGKSVLVNYILSQIKDRFEDAYVFSQTSEVQPLMWTAFHRTRIHHGYSSAQLSEIFQERRVAMQKVNEEFKEKRKKDVGSHKMTKNDELFYKKLLDKHVKDTLILLDDIVGDSQIRTCSLFQNIFTLGRHYRLSLIILSQNANRRGAINRECTGNADYAFTSSMLLQDDYQVLAEQYWGTEGSRRGAQFIAENTSEDYVFLFTDNTNKTKNRRRLLDHSFTYKAPAPDDLKRYVIGRKPWELEKEMEKEERKRKRTVPLSLAEPSVYLAPQNNPRVTHYQVMSDTMLPSDVSALREGGAFTYRVRGPSDYYDN
jgi:hypothetical protein